MRPGPAVKDLPGTRWLLEPGDVIRRTELHRQYGGGGQGGIAPSAISPNVLIFSDTSAGSTHGYIYDGWDPTDPRLFYYTGEGQEGDQQLIRGNRAILKHEEHRRALRLFSGVRGDVTYVGEFGLADPPFTMRPAHSTQSSATRQVVVFNLVRLDSRPTTPPQWHDESRFRD
jgi:hypothetical protein